MESSNYKSVRIKKETYKTMKKIALGEEIPFTQLMDKLLELYNEKKSLISPT